MATTDPTAWAAAPAEMAEKVAVARVLSWHQAEAASAAVHGGRLITRGLAHYLTLDVARDHHRPVLAGERGAGALAYWWDHHITPSGAGRSQHMRWASVALHYARGGDDWTHRAPLLPEAAVGWPIYVAAAQAASFPSEPNPAWDDPVWVVGVECVSVLVGAATEKQARHWGPTQAKIVYPGRRFGRVLHAEQLADGQYGVDVEVLP